MKRLLALGAVIVAAATLLARQRAFFGTQPIDEVSFSTWINNAKRQYRSPDEQQYRKEIFTRNLAKIKEINNRQKDFELALNDFSDLTEDEFRAKYQGLKLPSQREIVPEPAEEINKKAEGPSHAQTGSIDWRARGTITPIKDQRQCGSCWAFAATSTIESAWKVSKGVLPVLSEQQMVDCAGSYGNYGCDGGWMGNAYRYVRDIGGQMSSSAYPYVASAQACRFSAAQVVSKVIAWYDIAKNDCLGLLRRLSTSPVAVGLDANTMMFYKSGVFSDTSCNPNAINHGVVVVGYGTDSLTKKNFWIVRNSWGTTWGEQGYIRMDRDAQTATGICGICTASTYPTV